MRMPGKIFINYRREDTWHAAGWLHELLIAEFGSERVFMDVESMAAGVDFHDMLKTEVSKCQVFLTIIGPDWLKVIDNNSGKRRIDNPDDWVRIEILQALSLQLLVIPVMIGDAPNLRVANLPEEMDILARKNAVRLRPERFNADANGLITQIRAALSEEDQKPYRSTKTSHAPPPKRQLQLLKNILEEGNLRLAKWVSLPRSNKQRIGQTIADCSGDELQFVTVSSFQCHSLAFDLAVFQHLISGITLHLIPGASFKMGVANEDADTDYCIAEYPDWNIEWNERETPQRILEIEPFLIGKFPVLQTEWDKLKFDFHLRDKRSNISPGSPIDMVSWYDIQLYLQATGLRLPSEAEWEFACRATTETRFFWGDEMNDDYCWYIRNSDSKIQPVERHYEKANPFGLIDLLGNVWEWSADDWHHNYIGAPLDSKPWVGKEDQRHASMRGGGWNNWPSGCRATFRSHWAKEDRLNNTGFRVAHSILPNT